MHTCVHSCKLTQLTLNDLEVIGEVPNSYSTSSETDHCCRLVADNHCVWLLSCELCSQEERMTRLCKELVALYTLCERMSIKLYLIMQVVGSAKLNAQMVIKNEQLYKGIVDCFSKTYREAGIRGLYRGVGMHF